MKLINRLDLKLTAFLTFLFMSLSSHASEHTGYWSQITPSGLEFKCQGVYSKDQLVSTLRKAGWNVDKSIPKVNWVRDEAVVVAPSSYYKKGKMVFYGLNRTNDGIVLDYGWISNASESVSANSATFGSVSEGKPTTIVITYKRGLDNGLQFTCSNRGMQ
uniref:hypothetical protein n=1 Tax=Marinobacterium profundum TaxID=1714300 RepID=UPI000ADE1AB6|nr:hypothetical protein [Marinobacterium profundum]